MTTGDSVSPGNFGMLEQVQALRASFRNLPDTPKNVRNEAVFNKKVKLMICLNSQEGEKTLGFMANSSFGIEESVDDGESPSFFKEFVTRLPQA